MLEVKLEPEDEHRFAELVERNGLTVDKALRTAVERMMEDLEDILLAEAALKDYDPSKNVSLEELRRELGLDA